MAELSDNDLLRLRRFILIGSESPTFKSDSIQAVIKGKLTKNDCPTLVRLLPTSSGFKVIREIKRLVKESIPLEEGGAGYNKSAACFSLVLCIKLTKTDAERAEAYYSLPVICPTSEDLFLFHFYLCKYTNNECEVIPKNVASEAPQRSNNTTGATTGNKIIGTNKNITSFRGVPRTPRPSSHKSAEAVPKSGANEEGPPCKKKRANCNAGTKKALNRWYNSKDPEELAREVTAMTTRFGQTHYKLIIDYHVNAKLPALDVILTYIMGHSPQKSTTSSIEQLTEKLKKTNLDDKAKDIFEYFKNYSRMVELSNWNQKDKKGEKRSLKSKEKAKAEWLIGDKPQAAADICANIPVEILNGVPNIFWKSPPVLNALVPKMTIRQILHHLPRLSDCGLVSSAPQSDKVHPLTILLDEEKMKLEKIHPFEIISALRRFEMGRFRPVTLPAKAEKEHKPRHCATESWEVQPEVIEACCNAFALSKNLLPKSSMTVLVVVEVTPKSKEATVNGLMGMTAIDIAAVMIPAFKAKHSCTVKAFARRDTPDKADDDFQIDLEFPTVDISPNDPPTSVRNKLDSILSSPPDICGLLKELMHQNLKFDAIVLFCGALSTPPHTKDGWPKDVLKLYREKFGIKTKLVVVGSAAKMFTIADNEDPDSLDFVGFGASSPPQIHKFVEEGWASPA